MSVLDRWGKLRRDRPSAVLFITRNLPRAELGRLYDEIDEFSRAIGAELIVVPCDEFGVCPEYRDVADGAHGLSASFVGIRTWMRRKLCETYGCRHARGRGDMSLKAAFDALQIAEGRLRSAEEMLGAVEEALTGVADREERLTGARSLLSESRDAYVTALSRYYDAWARSRRLPSVRSVHGS